MHHAEFCTERSGRHAVNAAVGNQIVVLFGNVLEALDSAVRLADLKANLVGNLF